jgi:hypothetical protein
MKLWILRFVPYEGGGPIDGYFRTEESARRVFEGGKGIKSVFTDDFGIEVRVDTSRCACVLTNTEASAAFTAALQSANQSAAQAYGIPISIKGSTVQ